MALKIFIRLHDELADWMVRYVTVKRDNPDLQKTLDKIKEIRERYQQYLP